MSELIEVRGQLEDLSNKISKVTVFKPERLGRENLCPLTRRCEKSGVITAEDILPIIKDLINVLDYIAEHPYVERIVEIPVGYSLTLVKDK